jgi:hypothetical protein
MHSQEVVDRALANARLGISDQKNAEMCGVSVSTLRNWKYGLRRKPPDPARPGVHDRRIKRDCPRCFPRELDRRTYAYLLGLYLGDGHIVATNKGCYRLSICCSNDWPGLIDAAARAVETTMPRSKVALRAGTGCTNVNSQSKHWPCLFPQHGPGMKHTRKIELADWQQEITEEYGQEFVRGLIHSDGCRATNRVRRLVGGACKEYEYPRYFFSNASDDIRDLFTDALDRLGIAWKQSNVRIISVARKEAVARLDEFVGPKY